MKLAVLYDLLNLLHKPATDPDRAKQIADNLAVLFELTGNTTADFHATVDYLAKYAADPFFELSPFKFEDYRQKKVNPLQIPCFDRAAQAGD